MSNNTLPPELVEKMRQIHDPFNNKSEQYAQIAVDYCFETFVPLNQQLKDIKQQRDELLEALRHIERICNGEIPEHEVFWHISREQTIKYGTD